MKRPLWKISVTVNPEAEDAVGELLQASFGEIPSSYTDARTGRTTVALYCHSKPDWSAVRKELPSRLRAIARFGIKTGNSNITLMRLKAQDWAESWKRHFRTITVRGRLLIKPSWSRTTARKGQAVVVLDPGLSFGTGHHPTTSFCLEQLVARRQPSQVQSLLDIGTGSGILAIAAARLGYAPILALDFDPESIRVAKENARRNRVNRSIRFLQEDVTRLSRQSSSRFSVVCANLISTLLLAERERILARVDQAGVLILAGILKTEFGAVRKAYENAGLRLVARKTGKEWTSAAFRWASDAKKRPKQNA